MSSDSSSRCAVCDRGAERLDPLVPNGFYAGLRVHLRCLGSPDGEAWRRNRALADPRYARYLDLTAIDLEIECSGCRASQAVSPKGVGTDAASWEMSCTRCHRVRPGITAYAGPAESRLYDELCRLANRFRRRPEAADVTERIETISSHSDACRDGTPCECGGHFSLAAPPRCVACTTVLIDSPFHINPAGRLRPT